MGHGQNHKWQNSLFFPEWLSVYFFCKSQIANVYPFIRTKMVHTCTPNCKPDATLSLSNPYASRISARREKMPDKQHKTTKTIKYCSRMFFVLDVCAKSVQLVRIVNVPSLTNSLQRKWSCQWTNRIIQNSNIQNWRASTCVASSL